MWGAVIAGIKALGGQFLQHRQEKSQAKHERALKRLEADNTIAANLTKGFKDEWWTLILSFPYLVAYYGILASDPEVIARSKEMFEAITILIPKEVWSTATIISIVVSFGGRVSDVLSHFGWGKGAPTERK